MELQVQASVKTRTFTRMFSQIKEECLVYRYKLVLTPEETALVQKAHLWGRQLTGLWATHEFDQKRIRLKGSAFEPLLREKANHPHHHMVGRFVDDGESGQFVREYALITLGDLAQNNGVSIWRPGNDPAAFISFEHEIWYGSHGMCISGAMRDVLQLMHDMSGSKYGAEFTRVAVDS